MNSTRWTLILGWIALGPPVWAQTTAPPRSVEAIEFFESKIRPVLVESCYECHNEAQTADGGLALDSRGGLLAGGDSGVVLVPGDPASSRLLAILRHQIDGLEMPRGGAALDDRVIADFERWIADGAIDPRDTAPNDTDITELLAWSATLNRRKEWWSFRPIGAPQPPAPLIGSEDSPSNPIDSFIRADLARLGLAPAVAAEPEVLVRRLFFTLTGLPPTADQARHWSLKIGAAEGADRQTVVETLIDELLSSIAFAERWARHWMDWIRYAESHGSEGDPSIDRAWAYRDYLIRAWLADVPYDRLLMEHLAGDLLESPRLDRTAGINESMIGPAHLRMVFHGFAPTDALDERVRFTDDQINVIGKAFLGLTISCARCHDHKFDPISQADYYAIFGILASCRPGRSVIDLPELQEHRLAQLRGLLEEIRQLIAERWEQSVRDPEESHHRWLRQKEIWSKSQSPSQIVSADTSDTNTADIRRWDLGKSEQASDWQALGIGLAAGPARAGQFSVTTEGQAIIDRIFPAGIYSHLVSSKHPGRLLSPDIQLSDEWEVWVRVIGQGDASLRYVVQHYPRNGTVYPVVTLKPEWTWQRLDLSYWTGDEVHLELATAADAPLLVKPSPRSWFGISAVVLRPKGSGPPTSLPPPLDRLRTAIAGASEQDLVAIENEYTAQVRSAVEAWGSGQATDADAMLLDGLARSGLLPVQLHELPDLRPLVERYRAWESEVPVPTRVPGLDETPGRDWPLMIRGDHKHFGDVVPRRFLEAIDPTPYPKSGSGRKHLATDLVRLDNPLPRRVIVNRLWHHLFGRGIVSTPDNFGRLGNLPTHPELLDYLANRLVKEGWSLKRMIRLIVSSQTWQQDSKPSSQAQQLDPDNRWLSHAPVRRLEAEAIRDNLLAVSGALDTTSYGPPTTTESGRRSVYLAVRRNTLDPFLRTFDYPEPFSTTGARSATNVPGQALTLMNDPFVASAARAWSDRAFASPKTSPLERSDAGHLAELLAAKARIDNLFWATFSRPATEPEIDNALRYLRTLRQRRQEARTTLDEFATADAQDQHELQALVSVAKQQLHRSSAGTPATAPAAKVAPPQPLLQWEPEVKASEAWELRQGAETNELGLRLDGNAYAISRPLNQPLRAKTLEAWVTLDQLDQRGGGVISVQSVDGLRFDAIVFGEQQPGHWLAGSDHFSRTQPFGGPPETEATTRPVHLAIAYHPDGTVVGYRDGLRYGVSFQSSGPLELSAHEAIVTLGLRHLPATGNRMLTGTILRARLYDRALTDDEILTSFRAIPTFVSESDAIESLQPAERQRALALRTRIHDRSKPRTGLLAIAANDDANEEERAVWSDLVRALFMTQEFIYLR